MKLVHNCGLPIIMDHTVLVDTVNINIVSKVGFEA